jgi:phosphatidylglycerol:prolipoprotein diacylglycerol transferase
VLFCVYLILNGVERFLIEHIRVNVPFLGSWTQAEVISLGLVILGTAGILWLRNNLRNGQAQGTH